MVSTWEGGSSLDWAAVGLCTLITAGARKICRDCNVPQVQSGGDNLDAGLAFGIGSKLKTQSFGGKHLLLRGG